MSVYYGDVSLALVAYLDGLCKLVLLGVMTRITVSLEQQKKEMLYNLLRF
ncbi:MAG: hypothetical protein AAGF95_06940 [Chloroflexota bacterium]